MWDILYTTKRIRKVCPKYKPVYWACPNIKTNSDLFTQDFSKHNQINQDLHTTSERVHTRMQNCMYTVLFLFEMFLAFNDIKPNIYLVFYKD